MHKTFKKFTAYVLLVAMVFSIFLQPVYGNYQGPVADIMLQHISSQGGEYRLRVSWTSGVPSARTEPGAINGAESHTPEGYEVHMRNATANSAERVIHDYTNVQANDSGGIQYQYEGNLQLDRGSLYFFGVRPYHFHAYSGANGTTESRRAPVDNTVFHPQAIFMTDLQVDATGEGNSLTVTWDNPTYNNGQSLDYLISYSPGGAEVTNFRNSVVVPGSSATVIQDPNRNGTRLRTVITNPTEILPGTRYTVKVEPLINGQTLSYYRNRNEIPRLQIGSNTYPFIASGREYRNNQVFTYIPLEIYEDGGNYLRLNWWGLNEGSTATTKIRSLQIVKSTNLESPASDFQTVATLYSEDAYRIGNYRVLKPANSESTVYRIQVFYEGNNSQNPDMVSKWVIYNPSDVKVTPNKPEIRNTVPVIQGNNQYRLEITWDAFVRPPYNDKEEALKRPNGTYLDKDVVYDIWITDNLEHLYARTVPPVLTDLSAVGLQEVVTVVSGKNVDGYKRIFNTYVRVNENNSYQQNVPIEPNKLYYIQIVAKKKLSYISENIKDEFISEPAYSSVYFTPDGNVYIPQMISKPPLKIRKDVDGQEMITENGATVEWRDRWIEIYNPADKQWYSKVREVSGQLQFNFEGEGIELKSEDDLKKLTVSDMVYRAVDLDENIRYEMKVVPYTEIELEIQKGTYADFKDYIQKITQEEEQTGWNRVAYTRDLNDQTNHTLYYTIDDKKSNTDYVVLLRAYRILPNGQRLTAAYPSYQMFTTLPPEEPLYPTPTVPQLVLVPPPGDIEITVQWEYAQAFGYEIAYSEKEEADPARGMVIPSTELANAQIVGDSKRWTITNLFPETEYYIWIRAIQDSPDGRQYSEWSVPLQVKTTDIATPVPPDGIGLASRESLKIINDAANTEYQPSDDHYLIIEWLKDIRDKSAETRSTGGTGQQYEILSHELIQLTKLVKFNELIANRPYYVRIKTKVTVSQQGNEVVKTYSYIVQLADNDEFVDAIEVEVGRANNGVTGKTKQKESEFSQTFRFVTRPNQAEYDGDVDPDTVILPGEDYELIYDRATQTLTYRFRSSDKDQQGNKDNRVEQRLISTLVQKRVYEFTVDLEKYQDRVIAQRIVEIPYTLWTAFEERKISLRVRTDTSMITFTPSTFRVDTFNQAPGKGDGSKIRISINTGLGQLPSPQPTRDYETIVIPQQLQVNLQTSQGIYTTDYMGAPVQYQMKLRSRYEMEQKQVDGYIYDAGIGSWQRANGVYDQLNGEIVFTTDRLGAYGVYGIKGPSAGSITHWTDEAMRSIITKYNIADLQKYTYNPNQTLTAMQAINLIGGIGLNKKDVYINAALSAAEQQQLKRAGLYIDGINASTQAFREEIIPLIVKLYEIKTGYPIQADTSYRNQIRDYTSVPTKHQTSMLKAKKIGLLGQSDYIYPKKAITIGEMFYMLDIVVQDAGL